MMPPIVWGIENLVWASAAMLFVLAIRRPVARLFGAAIAYALWLIPMARLIAPPADWLAALFATPLPSLPPLIVLTDGAGVASSPFAGPGQWAPILLAVWAGGAAIFLGVQALRFRRFLARLEPMIGAGEHDGVPLVTSQAAEGPLALGLIHRRIIVPVDFAARYTIQERRLALEHERYHHRRGDIFANHVALVVLALNWFNPVAWLAFRAFRADQELSCDAAIIGRAATPQARCEYASALVKSASPPGLVSACPLNGADQLKRRLKMLKTHRRDPRRLLAGSAVAGSLIIASMAFGSAGLAQDTAEPKQERRVIIMEHHDGPAAGTPGAREERRETIIRRHGDGAGLRHRLDPEMEARVERCRGGNDALVDSNEGEGNQRTRILICGQGEGAPADQVTALQRARERLAENDELSAEVKQRVLAQIDQAIARARNRN